MTVFYGVVFALLMMIDWTQGALSGGIWAMTVNGIGLLLGIILCSLLSWKNCRKRVYYIWGILWSIGTAIAFIIWKQDINHVLEGKFFTAALNIGMIGVLMIRYWQEGIFQQFIRGAHRRQMVLGGLWATMTLWMCVSPQRSLWQIVFFVLFTLFYLLPLNEIQKKQIVKGALYGIVAGFFVLQILAFGFRPYDEVRYKGFYVNCNNNALMYLVTYIAVLTLILDWERQKKSRGRTWCLIFLYMLAGGLLGFQLMTMTRTVLLMDMIITICFLGIKGVQYFREKRQGLGILGALVGRGILLVGLLVLLFPAVFGAVRYLPAILHRPVWFSYEYSPMRVHSFDPHDSYKYIDFPEFAETFLGRFGIEVSEELEDSVEDILDAMGAMDYDFELGNMLEKGEDLGEIALEEANESTAIRLQIFEIYLKNLNMTGHTMQEGMYKITENYYSYHAHNVFLQMLYIYGIPAGILFIVLAVILGVKSFKAFLKRPFDSWAVFRGFVYLVFFGFGMLEITWNTGQITLFLLFFAQKELEIGEL